MLFLLYLCTIFFDFSCLLLKNIVPLQPNGTIIVRIPMTTIIFTIKKNETYEKVYL